MKVTVLLLTKEIYYSGKNGVNKVIWKGSIKLFQIKYLVPVKKKKEAVIH